MPLRPSSNSISNPPEIARRREDKRRRHTEPYLLKSGGLKTLPLPYDILEVMGLPLIAFVANAVGLLCYERFDKVITTMVIRPLDEPT